MSSLWTPEGEHRVPRAGEAEPPPGAGAGDAEPTDAELETQMAELQEELARTPAEAVVANHAYGLFELAALHLGQRPPRLDQARVAVDALAALVEGMAGRLGSHEPQLLDGLAQIRLAFVQLSETARAGDGSG
ncbi:MAG: hypothetical protein ACRDZQ_08090 [Acidimicrobiales bacterium]